MLEWLANDPLNGIVITITFFISIIIGRIVREKRNAYREKIFDARIMMFFAFLLIISITMLQHWYFPIMISVICLLISIKFTSMHEYFKKLFFPLVLGVFILALQSFTYGFLILSKIIASASVLIILSLSTSMDDMIESMRWSGVPSAILDISWFMKRYIQSFTDEGKKLKIAQESRCGFSKNLGFIQKMHNIASISGLLIIHAFDRSEQVYRAMLSRCWRSDMHVMNEHKPVCGKDIVTALVLFSGIVIMVGLDRLM